MLAEHARTMAMAAPNDSQRTTRQGNHPDVSRRKLSSSGRIISSSSGPKGAAVQKLSQHTGSIGQAIGTALLIKR